jgi:hypothetical protein
MLEPCSSFEQTHCRGCRAASVVGSRARDDAAAQIINLKPGMDGPGIHWTIENLRCVHPV